MQKGLWKVSLFTNAGKGGPMEDYLDSLMVSTDWIPTDVLFIALIVGYLFDWMGKGFPLPFRKNRKNKNHNLRDDRKRISS